MSKMSFIELAIKVLEEAKKPLSVDDIWAIAKNKGYDQAVGSNGKTPTATLGARLYVDIRDNPNSVFCKAGTSPQRFYLKQLSPSLNLNDDLVEPEEVSAKKPKLDYLEKDLHPVLAQFAYLHLKAYTKTIQHSKSGKKEYGEWTHPDMVGCYFPIDEWKSEIFELSSIVSNLPVKLFSFEIKRTLSFANLRESFFQTVSNSSWANESYLAASEISGDEEFRNELRRLSSSFGIGIILLDNTTSQLSSQSSEILFPASKREYLDWDMMNKLANMNSDFKSFIKRIKIDIQSKEIRKEWYDSPSLKKGDS